MKELPQAGWAQTTRARLLAAGALLRLRPFDVSTAEGQSKERYRRTALTALAALASKGVTLLTLLVSVPLTVNYLGAERFGLWMAVSALIAFLNLLDFGVGNGLLNRVVEANGHGDRGGVHAAVSSGFFLLCGLAAALLTVFAVAYPLLPWPGLFNVRSAAAMAEVGPAVSAFVLTFAFGLPLSVVSRVQLGFQEGLFSNLWQMAGNLAGFVGLLVVVACQGGLVWLVTAVTGLPVLVQALNGAHYFQRLRPGLRPRWNACTAAECHRLAHTGGALFLLQVFALVWNYLDVFVLTHAVSLEAAGHYAVLLRMFAATMVAQFFITALWPAYGDALARRDTAWARRTLSRALLGSLGLCVAAGLPLVLWGDWLAADVLRAGFRPDKMLLTAFLVLSALMLVCGNLSMLLVHGEFLRRQVWFYGLAAGVALALKLTVVGSHGIAGVVWAGNLAFGIIYTPFAWALAREAITDGAAPERARTTTT
jgi:O-antigen/teichoic acid export membrane protein